MSGNTSQPSPEKILCILCIDVNQIQIYPCLTMNRFPATRRKRLFQVSQAPALVCGSFEEKRPIVNEDEPPMDTNRHED